MNQQKKLPNELTDEELLKIASGEVVEDVFEQKTAHKFQNDILNFLTFFNIKTGTHKVGRKLMYAVYMNWSLNKMTKPTFYEEMSKFIKLGTRYFHINKAAFELDEESLSFLKRNTHDLSKDSFKKKHFEAFIKFYGLTQGTYWVSSKDLYRIYDYWHYKNKPKGRLESAFFFRMSSLYFTKKQDGEAVYFGLGRSILNPAEEYRNEKEKKEQKKYGKVSSTTTES